MKINVAIDYNVPSIGEGADFRAENSIQAVTPLFCLYYVMCCLVFTIILKIFVILFCSYKNKLYICITK